jgi:hypothetical protein
VGESNDNDKEKLDFFLDYFSHSFSLSLAVVKDPSTWGLYRLARQHWLKPSRLLGDNDLRVLETLVLCPRKDFLGNKIHAINLGAEMRQDEVRPLSLSLSLSLSGLSLMLFLSCRVVSCASRRRSARTR